MNIARRASRTVLVLLALPTSLAAQIAWETPRMIGPESPGGVGVYWLHASALGPDVDGGFGTWTLPTTGGALRLRGGAAVDEDDNVSAFGGLDLRAPIASHTAEQPLDLVWTAGIGASSALEGGQHVVVTVPMGVGAGRSWSSGAIWLAPYVSVGLALDVHFGNDAPADEFEVYPAVDLGLDLALDPGRNFVIRFATSLGDRQALAVGLNIGG